MQGGVPQDGQDQQGDRRGSAAGRAVCSAAVRSAAVRSAACSAVSSAVCSGRRGPNWPGVRWYPPSSPGRPRLHCLLELHRAGEARRCAVRCYHPSGRADQGRAARQGRLLHGQPRSLTLTLTLTVILTLTLPLTPALTLTLTLTLTLAVTQANPAVASAAERQTWDLWCKRTCEPPSGRRAA